MGLIQNFPNFNLGAPSAGALNAAVTKILEVVGGVYVPAPPTAPTRYPGALTRDNFALTLKIRPEQLLEARGLIAAMPGYSNVVANGTPLGVDGTIVGVELSTTIAADLFDFTLKFKADTTTFSFSVNDPKMRRTGKAGLWPFYLPVTAEDKLVWTSATVGGRVLLWIATGHVR